MSLPFSQCMVAILLFHFPSPSLLLCLRLQRCNNPSILFWADVSKNLHLAASKYKVAADRHHRVSSKFLPGDKAGLSTKNISLRIPPIKFAPRFNGPFTILCPVNPVAFKLRHPSHLRFPNVFYVSLLDLYIINKFSLSFSNSQYHRSVRSQANLGF